MHTRMNHAYLHGVCEYIRHLFSRWVTLVCGLGYISGQNAESSAVMRTAKSIDIAFLTKHATFVFQAVLQPPLRAHRSAEMTEK